MSLNYCVPEFKQKLVTLQSRETCQLKSQGDRRTGSVAQIFATKDLSGTETATGVSVNTKRTTCSSHHVVRIIKQMNTIRYVGILVISRNRNIIMCVISFSVK